MTNENPASRIGDLLINHPVVVTGGGSGIGRATAYACAAEGACVLVADLNGDTAEETAQQINAAGGQAIAPAEPEPTRFLSPLAEPVMSASPRPVKHSPRSA